MEPVLWAEPFDGDDWVFQVKWDGVRILACIDNATVRLYTRNGRDWTGRFPELGCLPGRFKAGTGVLDGEVIVLGDDGTPSFYNVMRRGLAADPGRLLLAKYPVTYMVFDILYSGGQWLTSTPLCERQRVLTEVLTFRDNIIYCENHPSGTDLFKVVKSYGMEGIVAKEKSGLYYTGRKHPTWKKVKCFREMQAVIGGVLFENGVPKALALGMREDTGLLYIGRAATGLDSAKWRNITALAHGLVLEKSPFLNPPKLEKGIRVVWLRPAVTATISYLEWTEHGTLRSPVVKEIQFNRQALK